MIVPVGAEEQGSDWLLVVEAFNRKCYAGVKEMRSLLAFYWLLVLLCASAACAGEANIDLQFYSPSLEFKDDFGGYKSPLIFEDGHRASTPTEWELRRKQILQGWHRIMGPWPELLREPRLEYIGASNREDFVQHRVRIETSAGQMTAGYLLIPKGEGRRPAVIIPFYEPEASIGGGKPLLDFGYQLTKRGFVTLSIGSPGGDAWKPETGRAACQPLSFLGYIAANCHTALSRLKEVDPKRIGIVGHSYGGKWALFGSCL